MHLRLLKNRTSRRRNKKCLGQGLIAELMLMLFHSLIYSSIVSVGEQWGGDFVGIFYVSKTCFEARCWNFRN